MDSDGKVDEGVVGNSLRQHASFNPSGNDSSLVGFAHELKTPLAIVCGYIEILRDGTLGPLNENQMKVLRDAAGNCSRLKKFVQEFLSQVALNAQQVKLQLELRDLNKCITEVCDFWKQPVQAKKMALYFQPDPSIKPFLFDFDKVQHIVSNLLGNALKFTPSGGTVWLIVQRVRTELNPRETATSSRGINGRRRSIPAVRVTVSDTGPGIPAEFRTQVFEEFYRIPCGDNPDGEGLGLSIAERLVKAHGGRIWVESEPGAGTQISFLLPCRRKPV